MTKVPPAPTLSTFRRHQQTETKNPAGETAGLLPKRAHSQKDEANMTPQTTVVNGRVSQKPPVTLFAKAMTPPEHGVAVREGRLSVSPALARTMLADHNYIRQRGLKPWRLHRHKVRIQRGAWDPDFTIRFARLGGRLILVDGQHRLTAIAEADTPCSVMVVITSVGSEADVHALYSRIDVDDGNRSNADILHAADPTQGRQIGNELRRSAFACMDALANDFPEGRLKVTENELVTKEDRIACLSYWLDELEVYDAILRKAQGNLRDRLRQPGVVAGALAILRDQPQRGADFLNRVGANTLLKPGDPEQALINFLLTGVLVRGNHSGERAVAQAWNASFKGKRLAKITIKDDPIRFLGTSFAKAA